MITMYSNLSGSVFIFGKKCQKISQGAKNQIVALLLRNVENDKYFYCTIDYLNFSEICIESIDYINFLQLSTYYY